MALAPEAGSGIRPRHLPGCYAAPQAGSILRFLHSVARRVVASASLYSTTSGAFVGREWELRELDTGLADTIAGRGRLFPAPRRGGGGSGRQGFVNFGA